MTRQNVAASHGMSLIWRTSRECHASHENDQDSSLRPVPERCGARINHTSYKGGAEHETPRARQALAAPRARGLLGSAATARYDLPLGNIFGLTPVVSALAIDFNCFLLIFLIFLVLLICGRKPAKGADQRA